MNSMDLDERIRSLEKEAVYALASMLREHPQSTVKLHQQLVVTSHMFCSHRWYAQYVVGFDNQHVVLDVTDVLGQQRHRMNIVNEVDDTLTVIRQIMRQMERKPNKEFQEATKC